jgi:hypothetical protein
VVDKTVLGSVSLSLKSAEESLLGTENLDGGGRVLGQVGQGTSVGDKTGGNNFANELGQVRGDNGHLVGQVLEDLLAVVGKGSNLLGEGDDVVHVGLGNVLTHRHLGGLNDGLRNVLIIVDVGSQLVEVLAGEVLLVLNVGNELAVGVVVGDNLDELGEVPSVPLTS